ncbi:amidase domain-containing protein [Lachnoclostridium sp. An196]|uniref:amidase domain-containing protein n=1 Tax=Lachnoclostridium sp. An196 TaxID=1965583 RepID=UPI00117BD80A|nr:amidase domain-containing protein [Lachnoclostridium sp. An196]
MKKLFRTMPAVVLAVLLTGCGQGTQETMNAGYEETANAETEAAPGSGTGTAGEETDAGTESVGPDETTSAWRYQGSGTVTGSDALTEGQQEILLEFMDAYYQSMAELEVQDCSGLFIEDGGHEQFRAQVDGTSWAAVTDNQTQEDGCVQVEVMEYADMRFAHTPDTDSSVTGVWHSFVMREADGKWFLTHHAAYDSAYFGFLRWENSSTGRSTETASEEELEAIARQRIRAAEEQIALRGQQAAGEAVPEAEHAYDREAAVAYAREWAGERNPRWQAYDGSGGNCMNFVSQSLYASGIPMDESGDARWYWYSDGNRAPAWTGVDSFRVYARDNTGYGLSAQVGAAYDTGEEGDVILMSADGNYHHAVIISQAVRDEDGRTIDYLICSNTGNYRDFPVSAYVYAEQELVRIAGWNG